MWKSGVFNLAIVVFFCYFSAAQEAPTSLDKKIDFIYDLSVININEALTETEKLIEQNQNDASSQARIYLPLVELKTIKGDLNEAIDDCKIGMQLAKEYNKDLVVRFETLLAQCYTETYQYDEALNLYDEILSNPSIKNSKSIFLSTKYGFSDLNKKINKERESLNILLEILNDSSLFIENQPFRANLVLEIADLYNEIGDSDSTAFYLKYYNEDLALNTPEIIKSFKQRVQGNISYSNKEYRNAIGMYNTYLDDYQDFFQQFDVEIALRKGKAFFELQQFDSTFTVLNKIADQEDYSKKLSKKSLGSFYKLYSDVYKERGNDDLSDSSFKKYVQAREEYNSSKFKTQEGLFEIKTKEILAEGEQTKKKYENYITYISSILGFLILAGISLYFVKTQKDKKRFGELMATVQAYEQQKGMTANKPQKKSIVEELPRNLEREAKREKEEVNVPVEEEVAADIQESEHSIEEVLENRSSDTSPIKDEKIKELLDKLEKLKTSGYFLRQDSSLYNTAKRLKTNTSYLSSVINNTMNTNFNRFVNDIRMDFVILELKNNKRMRSYSVKGIAEEIGYKSADSFTKYFKESTGLSPSAFIRNLNKEFKI